MKQTRTAFETEHEKFYRAKNERRANRKQWWEDNGVKFVDYPLFALVGALVIFFICILTFIVGALVCGLDLKKLKRIQNEERTTVVHEYYQTTNGWYIQTK